MWKQCVWVCAGRGEQVGDGAGGDVGGATLQSVLWLRKLRMRRERPRGSGDK